MNRKTCDIQGETDHECAMYSDCTEFNRSPKLTVTPIFHPQRNREKFFQLHETPQSGTVEGWGSVLENVHI